MNGGMNGVRRIAMWSGPRNISTAMMRSWGNRPDTHVVDEPFYAHYLNETGLDHPGWEEVIAHQEPDWRKVADTLLGPLPAGRTIFYQKHMAHHLLSGMGGDWIDGLTHAFLIRDPRAMLASYTRTRETVTLEDTGLPQQRTLFEKLADAEGSPPPVVDSRDILMDPPRMLRRLCEALEVPFDEAMLSWPPGPRPTDGVWAPYWYHAVERSTGFQRYQEKTVGLPDHLERLAEDCLPYYQALHAHRLT
ncbi:hypothetical protein [Inquilinus sp. CAU 1745]|uniref:sulfotransferase-like domain-containing protein n=1 Tax=Inquilinus sp. CAU 1745 TaxID=3140369 RepID=UPI00325ADA91